MGVLAACLMPAAPAAAAPTWLAPVDVSAPADNIPLDVYTNRSTVHVATDAAGNAVAVWSQQKGSTWKVQFAVRPAGQGWGAPKDVFSGTQSISQLAMAMNAGGQAIVAWQDGDPLNFETGVITAAIRPPGGDFGAATPVSASGAFDPAVAINASGQMAVAWDIDDGTGINFNFQARVRTPADTAFEPVEQIVAAGSTYVPRLAMDDAGNIIAAWYRFNDDDAGGPNPAFYRVEFARRPAGQTFPATATFAAGAPAIDADNVDLGVDANDHFTLVWQTGDFNAHAQQIKAASLGLTGPLGPKDTISTSGDNIQPRVAIDPKANLAVVVYTHCAASCGQSGTVFYPNTQPGRVETSARPDGGQFDPPQALTAPSTFQWVPIVRSDPVGRATALFSAPGTNEAVIQALTRPPGAGTSFGGLLTISTPGPSGGFDAVSPDLAFDDEGNAVVTWRRTLPVPAPTHYLVQSTALDVAPPTFGAITTPTPIAGQPVTFTAAATDRLTGATIGWGFGDGAGGTGASATHTYAQPGTYLVHVTATDGAGNASAQDRSVTVLAPDADGDGVRADKDCDDTNKAIHPGATEIAGNLVDENCDTFKAPFPRVDVPITAFWTPGRPTILEKLLVLALPKGARVELRCLGSKKHKAKKVCPFRKTVKGKIRKHKTNLARGLSKRRRQFKAGAVVEVRVLVPGQIAEVKRYAIKGPVPGNVRLCILPFEKRPRKTCPDRL